MSTSLTVTSNYTGALAGEIFVQAFKKADTIAKNAITVLPNVIGSAFLPKLTHSAGLVAYACGWDPTGTVVYNEKTLETKKFSIQLELCKDEFFQTFQAKAAGFQSADNEIPTDIQTAILQALVDNQAAVVDNAIWNGDNTTNSVNGLFRQFTADTAVVKVSGVTITKSNVVDEIAKVYDAIIPEVEGDEDLVLLVSKNVAKAYKQAQAEMGLNTTVGDKELNYLGLRIESMSAFPNNRMVCARVKNLGFGTALLADHNEVRISDDEARLDGNVRAKMTFTLGAGYSFGEEIVYYRIA